ncbi:MAG: hypothetical protein HeimAB125_09610 [Candidatus Heimdallarchaeota archaeon AB_125]|nr:MAG: hypothetical protein HeimAB125_09610 [Candidatus Heimdallarchaeota archaeon AB_125]
MKNDTKDDDLEHPTTLKIYLLVRSKHPQDVGVREVQRELDLKSPSIASWHLDKLEIAGLLDKLKSNRYKLSEVEETRRKLQIPLKTSVKLYRGLFIPPIFLLLGFLITMSILTIIFMFVNTTIAAFNGTFGLVGGVIICLIEYRRVVSQIKNYTQKPEE